jgi:DNA-binding MarR family transcriptional regulator
MEREAARFLKALRGRRSQVAWARRLGYQGNPITNWERALRFPTARETLRVAALAGRDVQAAFRAFAPTAPLELVQGQYALAAWLDTLRGKTSVSELAARTGSSRFSVRRWLRGEAEPRLPDFFQLLDSLTGRLPEWVAAFVPIESVPSLAERHAKAEAAKRIAFEAPWSEAVLRLLETTEFRRRRRHDVSAVAQQLGVAPSDVQRCIDLLSESGIVTRVNGKYRVAGAQAVDTQGGRAALHQLKAHWARVAAERVLAPRAATDLFAYNVVSVSLEDAERIRAILRATFREIRGLVAASEPAEAVLVLNLQLLALFAGEPGAARKRPR